MLFHGSEHVVTRGYEDVFRAQGLTSVEDVLRAWCPEPPDPKRRSRVRELRVEGRHWFLKTYDYAGPWRLRTVFVPARVKREYRNLISLARLGLRVPQPIAYGQIRRYGFVTASFVITEAVEGAIDLRELADGKPAPFPPPPRKERRVLLGTFAHQLRRCHDAGWFLYTAFFKNLLLTHEPEGYAIHVIDVPFAHIWRTRLLPGLARVRDLACLQQGARRLLSRTQRLRFYKTYAGITNLEARDKALLRRVDAYQRKHYP